MHMALAVSAVLWCHLFDEVFVLCSHATDGFSDCCGHCEKDCEPSPCPGRVHGLRHRQVDLTHTILRVFCSLLPALYPNIGSTFWYLQVALKK